jgi:hypothetical protein
MRSPPVISKLRGCAEVPHERRARSAPAHHSARRTDHRHRHRRLRHGRQRRAHGDRVEPLLGAACWPAGLLGRAQSNDRGAASLGACGRRGLRGSGARGRGRDRSHVQAASGDRRLCGEQAAGTRRRAERALMPLRAGPHRSSARARASPSAARCDARARPPRYRAEVAHLRRAAQSSQLSYALPAVTSLSSAQCQVGATGALGAAALRCKTNTPVPATVAIGHARSLRAQRRANDHRDRHELRGQQCPGVPTIGRTRPRGEHLTCLFGA